MTAIAVQKLARADSVSIGFIGCGVQARSHFDVLRLVLPDLKEVVACSRSAASAERFVAMVRGAGLVARTTLEPREAIEGLDVIITTVPEGAQVLDLDTAWVTPGAFVGAVDLARSWKRGTLRAMDILATDEREQTRVLTASGRMTFAGPTKRISPIWRAAPSRGAVRRRNARCSISPVTRWPIWLWHRSFTRQRCGKAWVRGWRAELTVCFGSKPAAARLRLATRRGFAATANAFVLPFENAA
jgi:ornithine cyclodeaminase/alanine dehydrogenase-like protein (mu-crystallin family)